MVEKHFDWLLALESILLLSRNNTPDSSLRVGNIPGIARDEMHMYMENRPTGSQADIDPKIISVRMETVVEECLYLPGKSKHVGNFLISQVEERRNMSPRND